MSNSDLLSIVLVAGFIAAWKVLSMSNVPWWVCIVGAGGYALLLLYDRLQQKKEPR